MNNPKELSRDQARLQARIAQRRIDEIEKTLASGVQGPISLGMDKDTGEVIARLYDPTLSDADLLSCVSILEMLLSVEALAPLLNVMKNQGYSLAVRQQAAKAISAIGCNYVEKELKALRFSASPQLTELIDIALGQTKVA